MSRPVRPRDLVLMAERYAVSAANRREAVLTAASHLHSRYAADPEYLRCKRAHERRGKALDRLAAALDRQARAGGAS